FTSPWNLLEPDRVTTLRLPPAAPPNSGATLEAVTRNSATASCPTATRLDPLVSSRLSRPSMERLLLRARLPAKGKPLAGAAERTPALVRNVLEPAAGATPGASRTTPR